MRFKRGDIVVSAPGWTIGCYLIVKCDPTRPKNVYTGLSLPSLKSYMLSDASLSAKIGEATAEFLASLNNPNPGPDQAVINPAYDRGKRRAEYMSGYAVGADKERWQMLAAAKPGDYLTIILRGKTCQVQFNHVIEAGVKYVFNATNGNGTTYKYPLHVLAVKPCVTFTAITM